MRENRRAGTWQRHGRQSTIIPETRGTQMKLPRRRFLQLAAGAGALPAMSRIALAQAYPARLVRLVVGYPPGGPTDIVARIAAGWLSERIGQQVIVENRPGASGNVATEAVVRAAPDGYTLILTTAAHAINPSLFDRLGFNYARDRVGVASIMYGPNMMVLNPSVPAKTVPEFIAYAKANPGKVNMASPGTGTSIHVSGELFKMMAGIDMLHVPYRGSAPALTDLIGGQVHVMFDAMSSSIEHVKAGKLRALAVTTARRSELLPELPTIGEFLSGYEATTWWGICAPKGTPRDVVDLLNKEIGAGLADPKLKARIADLGCSVLAGSPADFGTLIATETEKWAKVVKFAGIKAD
jgi:tripartite-type tricarboxylate transporter receptor subunit TctC